MQVLQECGEENCYRGSWSIEVVRATTCAAILFLVLLGPSRAFARTAPTSADRPWHASQENPIEDAARKFRELRFDIDPNQTYSLTELIDLAERHNPETRVAWERARAQAAILGIARSELYPTLAAAALSQTSRSEDLSADRFVRQTIQDFQVELELNYTVFDFGGRSGRIAAAKAAVLAANFAFNDTHREIIYKVEQAYYRLLNAQGQEEAATASLTGGAGHPLSNEAIAAATRLLRDPDARISTPPC